MASKGAGTSSKKEGSKTPKVKKVKVKAISAPKDLTGQKGEKTEAQLDIEV